MKAILGRYSAQKALPYLLPVAVEGLNQLLRYLGTLHASDPTNQVLLACTALAVGDAIRALTSREKVRTVRHYIGQAPPPAYRIIDATEIR